VQLQARTDAQLEPVGRLALDGLRAQPGERVLDVGCGTGQTSVELARRVAPTGRVVGVDIAEPMVAAARQRAQEAGADNLELVLADAAVQTFDAPFDAIHSRFGVMFFSDSVAAFTHLHAQLKPTGRMAFVCWQALEVNDWALVPMTAVHRLVPHQPLPALMQPGFPGPFFFSDPDFVRQVLADAGFQHVEITPHEQPIHLGATMTLGEAVDFSMQIGPAARLIADADPTLQPTFREALTSAFAPYATAEGVWMTARTLVVTCVR
jgi:SAM-dependent methyltransferase